MTVRELIDKTGYEPLLLSEEDREITGGYAGDLLSWVMGRAQEGDAWVTIMTNMNVAAVAQLTDVACVVFAEGVEPDKEAVIKARLHGINMLGSPKGMFELCGEISDALRSADDDSAYAEDAE